MKPKKYKCHVCSRSFKEFIFFEGHFTFSAKCRVNFGSYMQCYMCREEFQNLAALKYHLSNHIIEKCCVQRDETPTNDVIQKESTTNTFHLCAICGRQFRKKYHLMEHLNIHSTNTAKRSSQMESNSVRRCAQIGSDHQSDKQNDANEQDVMQGSEPIHAPTRSLLTNLPFKSKGKLHQCSICKAQFSFRQILTRHKQVHVLGKLKCQICNVNFTYVSLLQHQKLFHPELVQSNSDTGSEPIHAPTRSLQTNLPFKSKGKLHECSICKAKFSFRCNLSKHRKVHVLGKLKCQICNVNFTYLSLLQHQKLFHSELAQSNSDTGSEPIHAPTRSLLTNLPFKSKGKLHQCSICKAKFSFRGNLSNHRKVHVLGKLKCQICNVDFTHVSLLQHQKLFHPELVQSNSDTGIEKNVKRQISANPLKISMHGKKIIGQPNQCRLCKVSFVQLVNLKRHMKVHTVGTVSCDICNVKFTRLTLKQHRKFFHSELVRSNKFNGSEKIMTNKIRIKTKKNSFTKSKPPNGSPHQCQLCGHTSTFNLKRHMKLHTFGKFTCKICNAKFTSFSLKYHQRTMHPQVAQGKHSKSTGIIEKIDVRQRSQRVLNDVRQRSQRVLNKPPPLQVPANEQAIKTKSVEASRNQCSICKKMFCNFSNMKIHKEMHTTGEFSCTICKIRFTFTSLKLHNKEVHPELLSDSICVPEDRQKDEGTSNEGNVQKVEDTLHQARFYPELRTLQDDSDDSKMTEISKTFECGKCSKSFTGSWHLEQHVRLHHDEIPEIRTFECYICAGIHPTFDDLNIHMSKHCVYEQWVDPATVYLSNWTHDQSQQILGNQPLVLVEKLDVQRINLKSLADFIQRREQSTTDLQSKHFGPLSYHELGTDAEIVETYQNSVSLTDYSIIDEMLNGDYITPAEDKEREHNKNVNIPISNGCGDLSAVQCEQSNEAINNDDCSELLSELLPDSVQEVDSTLLIGENNITSDVIVLSSDDDDDDVEIVYNITDVFHCYFCDQIFHTVKQLGAHRKLCSPSNF